MNAPFGKFIAFGAFRLFSEARLLERDGQPVVLGSRAIDILTLLVERAGEIVSKRDLVGRAWPDLTVEENSLRVQIAAIRKALGDGIDGARYISNVAGRGYCFVAPTTAHAVGPSPIPGTSSGLEPALPVVARLVGRDEVVQRITFLLHSYRFVTICGPGGMGKTSVAARVAEDARASFDDVVFLDLASIQDPALVVSSLASALGLLGHVPDPVPAVLAILRRNRVLVVFDSCEHVIEAAALLAERISRDVPSTCLLATSREPLLVAGEHVVQLAPLALPPLDRPLSAAQVLQFPAARLFADRAFAAGLHPDLSDAEAATIAFICRALDGIPLAIEIAASRAGRHGIVETAELLDGRFLLSWRGRRSATPRQQSLYSTLDWSFELLSPRAQTVLQELSVFPARFGLGSADAVVGEARDRDASTRETIEDLVAKSLISVELGEGVARYRLLDTTRAYVRARLESAGRTHEVAARHAGYVAEALAAIEHASTIGGGDPAAASDLLADVRAALTWCFGVRGDRGEAVRLCAMAAPFFIRLSLFDECRRWLERALPLLEQGERGGNMEMRMEDAYGIVLMLTQSNSERSRQATERAIELAHELGDARTEFRMLNRLGVLHRRTGEFDRLLPIAERAEAVAAAMDDPVAMVSARLMRGSSHALRGDQRRAHALLEDALAAQLATPADPGHFAYVGDARIPLSLTLWLRGLPDQAAAAARIISADGKDVLFSCLGLAWGAIVYQTLGDHAAAAERAELLRAKARRHQLGPYEAVGLGLAGEALLHEGELSLAVAQLASAVDRLRASRYGLYESIFGRSHALALMRADQVAQATRVVEGHIAALESIGGSYDLAEWLRIRGETQWRLGAADAAEASYRQSIALAEQQGALSWHLRSATSLAGLLAEQGRTPEAVATLGAAIAPLEEGFARPDFVAASTLLEELEQTAR